MNLKGQIELTIFLAIGLVVVISGIVYAGINIKEQQTTQTDTTTNAIAIDYFKYVGDINTKLVYDITKCDFKSDKIVKFKTLEQAHSFGFKNAPNCI